MNDSIEEEIKNRIQVDIDVFDEGLPERYANAWYGYLAGLTEWGVITSAIYQELHKLLPQIAASFPILPFDIENRRIYLNMDVTVLEHLQQRIQADIVAFGGDLPERYAIAWHGYLAAVLEWRGSIIQMEGYNRLTNLLPPVTFPNPILTIFTGRIYEIEIENFLRQDIDIFDRQLPERYSIAWNAYLGGLWEYGAITPITYRKLQALLPMTAQPDPIALIGIRRGAAPKLREPQLEHELAEHIRETFINIQGQSQEHFSIAWKAYLASLRQWHIIQQLQYNELLALLPPITYPDPTTTIRSAFE